MSDEKKDSQENTKLDEELSDLLDSALQDFTKEEVANKENNSEPQVTTSTAPALNMPEWSNDFVQQAASQFEENFANLFVGMDTNAQMTPEFIQQKFQQMADAAQQVLGNPSESGDSSTDIASSISQAIQGLSAGAEGLQAPLNEEDLMKIFSGPGNLGSQNDLLPFMQGMMQGLLSKEVLGPSLQDFVEKLPEYIEKNRNTLLKEDIERYENQKKLMEEVLDELNKENETDSAEIKKERFTKVLGLMQKLQDYGQVPLELVTDVDTPFAFDAQGNPALPNLPNQDCCIM